MQPEQLFIDCCTYSAMELCLDEASEKGLTKFRGRFQEADAVNKNKRTYPFAVLSSNVERLQESIDDRRLVGELDHPTDSIIHFANASHIVTRLWWEGNVLMGEGEILPTPHGKVLEALIGSGVKVGISSRGVGSGKTNEEGIFEIGESYKLITFDAVADPSTFSAFQEKVVTSPKQESVIRSMADQTTRKGRTSNNTRAKNESTSIDNVNKEALIACLGGIVKTQTEHQLSRLG